MYLCTLALWSPATGAINMFKKCTKCSEEKPHNEFPKASSGKGDLYGLRSQCKKCHSQTNLLWHKNNYVKSKENHDKWLKENSNKVKEYSKKWISENTEKHAETNKNWKKNNASRNSANSSRKRAAQLNATPLWLSAIQLAQIQEFYDVASAKSVQTGIKYHVDHIHPLQGDGFSGLHVPWNMQILTAKENIAKKNKIPAQEVNLFWGAL